jgi:hypothetical protein
MHAYQLSLPEPAPEYVEALLAGLVCPLHVGTTLDGGVCAICEVEAGVTGETGLTRGLPTSVAQPSDTQ